MLVLPSCNNTYTGKIVFELEGGVFLDDDFSTDSLVGEAGTPVTQTIPNPYKEGYYFVGWREKKKDGSYRTINKKLSDDGSSYYYYPYGTDTFYAYFEPLVTITFDLGIAKDGGKIIEPVYEKENFNVDTLSGYAGKDITSVDYLPTVDASDLHLNFQYWYSEYPLVLRKDENNTEHYIQDKSQAKGVYRFDKWSFRDSMEFLLNDLTLYAYYDEDPTITIHYNIEGLENHSFKAKANGTIKEELISDMYKKFSIDYSKDAEHYYYPLSSKDYRFEGFYLDEKFTNKFFMDSTIYTSSIDIYLKWANKITVTLDYNGGKVGDNESEILTGFYSGDTLGNDFYTGHTPVKDTGSFVYYTLDNETFDIYTDSLPDHDVTLVASYDEYPTLTLVYDYPDGYDQEKEQNFVKQIKSGENITSILSDFRNQMANDSLSASVFYTIDDGNKENEFTSTTMTDDDITIYLQLEYKSQLRVETWTNTNSSYEKNEDVPAMESYFGNQSINASDISGLETPVMINEEYYLYDGLYSDEGLTTTATFPIFMESSHTEKPILTLYRKMTKAITLTFYYEGSTTPIGTLPVIPNSRVYEYLSDISSLVGNYTSLEVDSRTLSTIMPSTDCDVIVKGHTE